MKQVANKLLASGYECEACGEYRPTQAVVILEDFREEKDGSSVFDDFHPLCGHHAGVLIPVGTPIINDWSDMF